MRSESTCTITFTKDELDYLRAAIYDSSSHWYNHLRAAQNDPDYFLDENGCRIVWEARCKLSTKWDELFERHFPNA